MNGLLHQRHPLFSIVYEQAALCAGVLVLGYAFLVVQGVLSKRTRVSAELQNGWVSLALIIVVVLHTTLLAATLWMPLAQGQQALNLGFAQALSLVTCVGVWLFIIESRWVAIDALRPIALTLPCIAVILAAASPPQPVLLQGNAVLHVLVAIAAHGVALLACGHAVLLLVLNRALKNGAITGWTALLAQQCPPLVVLERLLLRLSLWVAGLLAMTVGLGAWTGQMKLDHKTILTGASLLIWLSVAWGYKRQAWRGARLATVVFAATALLLLSYIGSRFVLQAILQR